MNFKVDYHFHSWYSDGTMKPTELVKSYKERGYDEIALTDHDGVDGVAEAQIAGEALGIQVITGIELSSDGFVQGNEENPLDVHILGYRFDIDSPLLRDKCKELMDQRRVRNLKLLKVLNEMGIELEYEDLVQRKGQTYIGKPNFARALVNKGYIEKPLDAFAEGKFLESPKAKEVKKVKMSTEEAISLLLTAGGTPVLAHPMELMGQSTYFAVENKEEFFEKLEKYLIKLKKSGLKGLECYHPSATEEDSIVLVNLAEKYHLHVTMGSDFHSPDL